MATVPSELSWAVGNRITAALLNSNLHDAVNFLINVPRVQVYQDTTAQSIADSTFTAITWNQESFDSDLMHTGSASTFVCVTPGTYMLSGQVTFAANTTGVRQARWAVNGAAVGIVNRLNPMLGGASIVSAPTWMVTLAATDTVSLLGYQSSGGALLTSIAVPTLSFASALWIST